MFLLHSTTSNGVASLFSPPAFHPSSILPPILLTLLHLLVSCFGSSGLGSAPRGVAFGSGAYVPLQFCSIG